MYTCIIIDDESHAIEGLKELVLNFPEFTITGSYTDPLTALQAIKKGEKIDVIFLDVDMPKINGIELAKEIRHKTDKLVFTTAHTKYAYEAFEIDANAFLSKPYSSGKFNITIDKLFPRSAITKVAAGDDNYFFFRSKRNENQLTRANYDDVIAVESEQNYVTFTIKGRETDKVYITLTELELLLTPERGFMRVSRSFIINLNEIVSVNGNTIKLSGNKEAVVGNSARKEFQDFVAKRLAKGAKKQ